MIRVAMATGSTYAVMGLGISGLAAAEALARSGAHVLAWDDDGDRRDAAAGRGLAITDLRAADLTGAAALVLSPGIPHRFPAPHPIAARALDAGVPIICDIELLLRARGAARVIGVTGTNGKSTVTALIGHILEAAEVPCAVGGNLGPAALGLPPLGADGIYVLELSSYQLERIETAGLDIAVLVNISPDHLDRHGGLQGYVAAKARACDLSRSEGAVAVIGADDAWCRAIAERIRPRADIRLVPISGAGPVAGGVWVEDGRVVDGTGQAPGVVADITGALALPGVHGRQNAAAATAAALAAGIEPPAIARGLVSYPGLPHRQEEIRRIGDVAYVNDSKATNPEAALRALECYERVFWIAGGRAKEGGFSALAPAFPRIRHAYLIGEAAGALVAALGGAVPHTVTGTLEAAVAAAHADARREARPAVVLLAPACASFDQFAGFEARGEAFRRIVAGLPGGRP
ncbi:MAG TPA: UDP-N-acetylmuramoyl-L-alanine--D-glutamate ligase [Alphaproteobacteria bacterium]